MAETKQATKKKKPFSWFSGYKTYLAAFGFFAMGVYLTFTKQYVSSATMYLGALSAAGLRHAIQKNKF